MEWLDFGKGAGGGGFLGALLVAMGFKSRFEAMEKKVANGLSAIQHDKECDLKLMPITKTLEKIAEKLDATHDAVIAMKSNTHKRAED